MRNAPTGSTLSAIRSVFLSFYFVVSVVCRASANFFKLNVGITETSAEFLERGLPDFFSFRGGNFVSFGVFVARKCVWQGVSNFQEKC